MTTGENFAFFIYRHFVERSIFQTFWKPDFGARFLFFNPLKNVVECYKEFFGYFNALETHGEKASICLDL